MFSGVRMKFLVVILIICEISALVEGKSTKKIKDDSISIRKKLIGKRKPPPAIIAIEIVDPKEEGKKKRTIDSSLGYGYRGEYSPPKYQVYKYSQRDIPPYRGPQNVFTGARHAHYDIQNSISYNRNGGGGLTRYYQPGTTLYSTVNNQGQVGSLSSHLPQQSYNHDPQVPVIILKVYPSQLADPAAVLHPNLPQNHPYANAVNSIDIQALLARYVQSLLLEQQQQYHYQSTYQYMQPQYQEYSPPSAGDDGLLTHENYPKDTHTRVIFHTHKNKVEQTHHHTETKTVPVAIPPSQPYSSVEVETPDKQYTYTSESEGDADGTTMYYYTPQDYNQQESQDIPLNYHYHQKRSKKNIYSSRFRLIQKQDDDELKLEPIKA